jgi:hypothetical protein
MGSSIQEREAELAALQSAFDEYITSSRELEEELDAELAKMRKFLLFIVVTTNIPTTTILCSCQTLWLLQVIHFHTFVIYSESS